MLTLSVWIDTLTPKRLSVDARKLLMTSAAEEARRGGARRRGHPGRAHGCGATDSVRPPVSAQPRGRSREPPGVSYDVAARRGLMRAVRSGAATARVQAADAAQASTLGLLARQH